MSSESLCHCGSQCANHTGQGCKSCAEHAWAMHGETPKAATPEVHCGECGHRGSQHTRSGSCVEHSCPCTNYHPEEQPMPAAICGRCKQLWRECGGKCEEHHDNEPIPDSEVTVPMSTLRKLPQNSTIMGAKWTRTMGGNLRASLTVIWTERVMGSVRGMVRTADFAIDDGEYLGDHCN